MAKRVFTEEERAEYREKMLDAGFDLLKKYGMTHMSVAKITEAAGIGVSTFYNFFASKEEYVYEVLQYRRRKRYSVFPSLTPEDEKRLLEMLPEQARPDLQKETETSMQFFRHMEGIRPDVNIPLVANLIKVYVLAAEGKEMLHQTVYEVTMDRMRDLILYEIFGRTE